MQKPTHLLNVNPTQFIYPRTKEAAYILGFLWADGYVCKAGKTIRIATGILEEDAIHLLPIFLVTGKWGSNKIIRINRQPQMLIHTHSKMFGDFLLSMNYGPHNSLAPTKMLNLIPKNLHHYWWRGYWDGDGCFYQNKTGNVTQMAVSSNYNQDWSFVEKLWTELDIKYTIQKNICKAGNRDSRVRCCNQTGITAFGNYIYQNYDGLGLPRKYGKWLNIINYTPVRKLKAHLRT